MDEFGDDMDPLFDPEPVKRSRGSRAYSAMRGAGRAISNRMPKKALDVMYGPKKGRFSPMRRFGMLNDIYQLSAAGSEIANGEYGLAADNLGYMAGWHGLNALAQKFAGPTAVRAGGKFLLGRAAGIAAGIPGMIATIGGPIAYDMYRESTGRPAMERLASSRMNLFESQKMNLLDGQPQSRPIDIEDYPEEYDQEGYDPEEVDPEYFDEDYEFA